MYNIEADCIADAHSKACKLVIEEGEYVLTEDKQPTLELTEPLAIKVTNGGNQPMRHHQYRMSGAMLEEYIPMMCAAGNKNGHAYTYGDRMRNYPDISYVEGEPLECYIDQIQSIVTALKQNPTSRRTIAHTWIVETDLFHKTPPCMQTVQFILRSGELNVVAYFRSNDMCTAWGSNAYGLTYLQHGVATALGVEAGYLQTISACAHIYETELNHARLIAYM